MLLKFCVVFNERSVDQSDKVTEEHFTEGRSKSDSFGLVSSGGDDTSKETGTRVLLKEGGAP